MQAPKNKKTPIENDRIKNLFLSFVIILIFFIWFTLCSVSCFKYCFLLNSWFKSVEEIRNLLIKLDTTADQIVRKNEEVYKKLNLKDSDQDLLIENISKNPILLERPIVVKGEKAIIGRPPENVMKLL